MRSDLADTDAAAQTVVTERAHMSVATSKAKGGLTTVLARPVRVQLRRTAGWRKPEGCIVVARPSRWGNLYAVGAGEVSWSGTVAGTGAGFYGSGRYQGDLGLGRAERGGGRLPVQLRQEDPGGGRHHRRGPDRVRALLEGFRARLWCRY